MKRNIKLIVAVGLLILNGMLTGVVIKRFIDAPKEEIVNSEMNFYEEFIVKSKNETMYLVTTKFTLYPTQLILHEDIAKTIQYYLECSFLTFDDITFEQESQCIFLVKCAIAMTADEFKCSSETRMIEVKRL